MKILVTGDRPTAGSWRIRAEQLGGAVGARVVPRTLEVAGHDVCVAVKRHNALLSAACRRAGVPLVWDIVDAWPQPAGNTWDEAAAKAWLHGELLRVTPALVIAATQRMADDVQGLGFPAVCVPHHARPARPRLAAEVVSVVGYDGSLVQLGAWHDVVAAECARRGWRFAPGLASEDVYSTFDIVLGLRAGEGYAPRHWKSGVKLANAQAAGIPFVGSPECGYEELRVPGAERFVETPGALRAAFDALTPRRERQRAADWMATVAPMVSLASVAERYRAALMRVART